MSNAMSEADTPLKVYDKMAPALRPEVTKFNTTLCPSMYWLAEAVRLKFTGGVLENDTLVPPLPSLAMIGYPPRREPERLKLRVLPLALTTLGTPAL